MRSIIYQLREDEFPRLRIGIGKPERQDLTSYVLGRFSQEDKEKIIEAIKKAREAIKLFISKGIQEAMNEFNGERI